MRPEAEAAGEAAHFRALESLWPPCRCEPVVRVDDGDRRGRLRPIRLEVREDLFHPAGAARGTLYFKMMDDAAVYACNSLGTDRFLLTTAFNLLFTRPLRSGPVVAEGRWASGRRRVYGGEARLIASGGELAASGAGTFMRSHIPLSTLAGYRPGGA